MRRALVPLIALLVAAAALSACGKDAETAPKGETSTTGGREERRPAPERPEEVQFSAESGGAAAAATLVVGRPVNALESRDPALAACDDALDAPDRATAVLVDVRMRVTSARATAVAIDLSLFAAPRRKGARVGSLIKRAVWATTERGRSTCRPPRRGGGTLRWPAAMARPGARLSTKAWLVVPDAPRGARGRAEVDGLLIRPVMSFRRGRPAGTMLTSGARLVDCPADRSLGLGRRPAAFVAIDPDLARARGCTEHRETTRATRRRTPPRERRAPRRRATPPTRTTEVTASGCERVAAPEPRGQGNRSGRFRRLDRDKTYLARVETNCGTITIRLDVRDSPRTSASFASLARAGFYDGLTFHRIARPGGSDFVVQGGDPTGTGNGGPGYSVREAPPESARYTRGVVAMAKTEIEDAGTSGSQFFIVTARNAKLPPDYAVLGRVVRGRRAVTRISRVPADPTTDMPIEPVVMRKVTISER